MTGSPSRCRSSAARNSSGAFTVSVCGVSVASSASDSVTPATIPGAPTDVSGVRGNGQVTVSWTAPTDNGGATITGYTVSASPQVGGVTKTCTTVGTSCAVTGLTNGVAYTFTVKATNAVNDSVASSASDSVTPATVPGAPTGVAGVRGDGEIAVSWTAPASNGGSAITGYTVSASPQVGGVTRTCTSVGTSCTVTGLTNGVSYTFTVVATNELGDSLASSASASATPATAPGAPTSVSGVRGNGQVTVSWTAPASNGGSAVTGYTVSASPQVGGVTKTCTTATTSCIVTGLTNGVAYTFTVKATNALGDSVESTTSSSVTPATVPGLPTNLEVLRGNARITVSWVAPVSNGGSAITGYTVQAYNAAFGTAVALKTCTTATTSCAVTGLTNLTNYKFAVKATNALGSSAFTALTAAIAPSAVTATAPGAPTTVTGVRGNGQATVSFTAPTETGGATITGYTVSASPQVGGVTKTCTTATTSCIVTGLTNGVAYTFTVKATNDIGDSVASAASAAVTPATVPGAPTAVAGAVGNARVTVSWTAPVDNGGSAVTGYTVQAYNATTGLAVALKTCTTATTSCAVAGLTNGTAYTFKVKATNAAGSGVESSASASVIPATAPGAPTAVGGLSGNGQVTVSWTAPATNGGSAITGYTVQAYDALLAAVFGATCSTSSTVCNVTDLTNGRAYTFKVFATNAAGDGVASVASAAVTPLSVPDAPEFVRGVRGNGQVTVSWNAPTANGGSAITGYTVTASPQVAGVTKTCTTATTSCVVTGLTNGTAYTFTVVATNTVGSSDNSAASASVTPAAVPGTPTITSVVANSGRSVTITWTAPAANGSAITGYTVQAYSWNGLAATIVAGKSCKTQGGTTTCTIPVLTVGTSYKFYVKATNGVGTGAAAISTSPVTAKN